MTFCQVWVAGREPVRVPHRWLPATERQRLQSIAHPTTRHASALAQVILRSLLAERLDVPPERVSLSRHCPRCDSREHGPPLAPGSGVSVSVAHADALVFVAVSDADAVGIDVELAEPARLSLSDTLVNFALNGPERVHVRALPASQRPHAFRQVWTRKEAVLKASGDGMRGAFEALRTTDVPPDRFTAQWPDGPSGRHYWGRDVIGVRGAIGAVCLTAPPTSMAVLDGDQALREGLHRWEGSARVLDAGG